MNPSRELAEICRHFARQHALHVSVANVLLAEIEELLLRLQKCAEIAALPDTPQRQELLSLFLHQVAQKRGQIDVPQLHASLAKAERDQEHLEARIAHLLAQL